MSRRNVLEQVADRVPSPDGRAALVGVDGPDGSGKTVFAGELAEALRARGHPTWLVHIDDFHAPRAVRYRRGRHSPERFLLDSYDDDAITHELLDPIHAATPFRMAVWDLDGDAPRPEERWLAGHGQVVIVEGIFLHRPLFDGRWDASVYLHASLDVAVRRMAGRDGTSPDAEHPSVRRYVEGQRLYRAECDPAARASMVVDNTRLDAPRLILRRRALRR